MKMHSTVHAVPQVFEELQTYNFSQLELQNDYAIGLSHAVKLTFGLPNEEGKYGAAEEGAVEFSILAIPCFDGEAVSSMEDLARQLG
jgi:hypothetical protein